MMTERVETWCYQRRPGCWLSGIHRVHVQSSPLGQGFKVHYEWKLLVFKPCLYICDMEDSYSSYLMVGLSGRTRRECDAKPVRGAVLYCVQHCGVRRRMYILERLRTFMQLFSHVLISSFKCRSSSFQILDASFSFIISADIWQRSAILRNN